MRIDLKSNQYYDFFNIRNIILTEEFIRIEGNFEKGKKYKKIKLRLEMVNSFSLMKLKSYMKKYMKRFDFEGICFYCESEDIWIEQNQTHRKEVNSPKPKYKSVKVEDKQYYCESCKRWFTKEQMKYSDVILYYN